MFLNSDDLGFKTTSKYLVEYTRDRDDIDAVHFTLKTPGWMRFLNFRPRTKLPIEGWLTWRQDLAWTQYYKWLLTRVLPYERFDAVHVLTQQKAGIFRWLKTRGGHVPKLIVNSDATTPEFNRVFGGYNAMFPGVDLAIERKNFAAADAVACNSEWVANSVVGDLGIDPSKVLLHRLCVSSEHSTRRVAGRIPEKPVRLVFIGNDWERKGGPRLLKWHQERWADDAELHICSGGAPVNTSCKNVVWHGGVPHDKLLRDVLPNMDVFVLPTYADTYLIAAQEAQLFGLPVVSSKLAGIKEVVRDGVTGFLREPQDDDGFMVAIDRLIDDGALRRQMSRAASDHIDRDLNADLWHTHLMDQIVALADGLRVRREPTPISTQRRGGPERRRVAV